MNEKTRLFFFFFSWKSILNGSVTRGITKKKTKKNSAIFSIVWIILCKIMFRFSSCLFTEQSRIESRAIQRRLLVSVNPLSLTSQFDSLNLNGQRHSARDLLRIFRIDTFCRISGFKYEWDCHLSSAYLGIILNS